MTDTREVRIEAGDESVSGLARIPGDAVALLVLAHGAGAGMRHVFLEALAERLARQGVGTLRYQFPYWEQQRRRPDPPAVATAAVRGAVRRAAELAPGLPLLAGGKSFGGRMTSTAQADEPLPGVRGLVFVGFPLHPPKRPATNRGDHLARAAGPLLFLQGTRDDLADLDLIRGVTAGLGPRATLHVVDGADHAFHVLKRSGRTDDEVLDELAATTRRWWDTVA